MTNSIEYARQLDSVDTLKNFRQQFIIPVVDGRPKIYFLGNSLGLQPKSTHEHIKTILDDWSALGVEAFFEGENPWLSYHDQLVQPLCEIVGAKPREVVVMNQLTVNLHLLMISFYKPSGKRNMIICEGKAFPSDQYVFETQVKHYGLNPAETIIEITPREGENHLRTEDIVRVIEDCGDRLALVLFGGINYYTGQLFDIAAITHAAQEVGAKAGFDLAHAVGNVALQLHDWNVDFAAWCSYKYLNSGPGAIAGAYVHERYHHDRTLQRFAGWWGYKSSERFQMKPDFEPGIGAEGWQLSTPSLILYACHKSALEIFSSAGMKELLEKSRRMSAFLFFLLHQIESEGDRTFEILTPQDPSARGSQVSLLFKRNGRKIFDFLREEEIFADWREPNVIRIAPVPLYNTFEEIFLFASALKKAIHHCKG